eukprot:7117912-Pyramimonas_sp.AAC.1
MEFTEACHWADQAGIPGAAFSAYAMEPGKQTGKYQQHLDKTITPPKNTYLVKTPVNYNRRPQRTTRDVPTLLAYESLEDELRSDSTTFDLLTAGPGQSEESVLDLAVYRNHRSVLKSIENGERLPVPLGFYLDGVNYRAQAAGRMDSTTGMWIINLLTGNRHLVSVTRSSDSCLCGCRGWCSLFPHLQAVRWQLDAMMAGRRPTERHDGAPMDADATPLSFRGCLIWIKGDWGEHAKSLGLTSWSS